MSVDVTSVTDMLEVRRTREAARLRIIQLYKDCITDWCGHDLAIELVHEQTKVPHAQIYNIVANAGNGIWEDPKVV
jgi:hypothetical protein